MQGQDIGKSLYCLTFDVLIVIHSYNNESTRERSAASLSRRVKVVYIGESVEEDTMQSGEPDVWLNIYICIYTSSDCSQVPGMEC